MNFGPELAALVMSGQKTVTRRVCSEKTRSPWFVNRCAYQPGKVFTVNPGRGKPNIGRARVISVERLLTAGQLEPEEAHREGFTSPEEFRAVWEALHGCSGLMVMVWRVEFEAIEETPLHQSLLAAACGGQLRCA